MKEVSFIRKNIEKWKEAEKVVDKAASAHPDRLADTYTELTSDLAFSQTHYPNSRITIYLNNLASALHNVIYRNKREKWTRVITYWSTEVPLSMYAARKELIISFAIFVVSVCVGVLSTLNDDTFARLIMGDRYIDMTLNNIAKGEPMGVYASMGEGYMFMAITLNNILVSFYVFVAGVLTAFATGYLLFSNGVMLGTFMTFLYQQGVLKDALPTVWLHGTLEIGAIIVAGAAGLALGNGWLFSGTYSRIASFRHGAKKGLKVVIGTVPIFIVAGFIESFFTRHTDASNLLRGTFILLSLAFLIFYYIILPKKRFYGTIKHPHNP